MTASPDFPPRGDGAPAALLELDAAEMSGASVTKRGMALDALVDDAWERLGPDDPCWRAIYLLLISREQKALAFREAYALAMRLLDIVSEVYVEHVDQEGGVTWRNVRALEAMQDDFARVIAQLKSELAEVAS